MHIEDALRGSGRTTRLVLHYIDFLIKNPGVRVQIRDHHDTQRMHKRTMMMVHEILMVLTVDHDTNQHDNSITVLPMPRKPE